MHYNYLLCYYFRARQKGKKLGSSTLSRTDSLISLMCGINIILSDIPELLVVCVARAMIQNCQAEGTHQSNSARRQFICLPVTGKKKKVYTTNMRPCFPFLFHVGALRTCHFLLFLQKKRGNKGSFWCFCFHKMINCDILMLICLTGRIEPLQQ